MHRKGALLVENSSQIATSTNLRWVPRSVNFLKVNQFSPFFKLIVSAFKKYIEPVYGSQKSAILKIKKGVDRQCEIMFSYSNPIGVLVYKNCLQAEYGLKEALELKSLFLLNADKNSGKGFGSILFERMDEIAQQMQARAIYCTASSKKMESVQCALKCGYKIKSILREDKRSTDFLLVKPT